MNLKVAIDTSFLISLFVNRDSTDKAKKILKETIRKYDEIYVPQQVITEFVYIMENIHKYSSTKKLPRKEISKLVDAVLNTPKFKCDSEEEIRSALDLYQKDKVKFGDSLILADMLSKGIRDIVSFDSEFKKIREINVYR